MIAAVVLAAGSSTRMGTPKALLPCGDLSFIDKILSDLDACGVGSISVVLGENPDHIAAAIRFPGRYQIVHNSNPQRGQLSSLQAGLQNLPGNVSGCLVTLVDHPLVQIDTYGKILKKVKEYPQSILIPVYKGIRGHPVYFGSAFFNDLQNAPLDKGARQVVSDHPGDIKQIETDDPGILRDIDTPDIYNRLLEEGKI